MVGSIKAGIGVEIGKRAKAALRIAGNRGRRWRLGQVLGIGQVVQLDRQGVEINRFWNARSIGRASGLTVDRIVPCAAFGGGRLV